MKKKMTVVGGLLMAVVLTGYSVAGTYAKYIDTASVSDSATVAAWNLTANATQTKNLFDTTENNATVNKRVAPGGANTTDFTVGVTGDAEVTYDVDVKIAVENNAMLELTDEIKASGITAEFMAKYPLLFANIGGKDYYTPVQFTVSGTKADDSSAVNVTTNKVDALQTAINDIVGTNGGTVTLGWSWAFEQATDTAIFDYLDTTLAKQASDKTIQITASATATQTTGENVKVNDVEIVKATAKDVAEAKTAFSAFNEADIAGVKLVGNKLTGSISENTALNDQFSSNTNDQTGYYYLLVVKGTANTSFTVKNNGINVTKTQTIGADGQEELLLALSNAEGANKTIEITMAGNTTTIDYSGLQFN